MGFIVILGVAILVGFGVLNLAAPDLMWSWTRWNNATKGLQSERTESWDMWRILWGVILIFAGFGFGVWGCGITSQQAAIVAERTAVYERREADKIARIASVYEAFGDVIPQLMEDATEEMQTVRAYKLGVETETYTTIDYGRCERSGDFYMYIFNYQGNRHIYAYGSGEGICEKHPSLLYFVSNGFLKGEHGGMWYVTEDYTPIPTDEAVTPEAATPHVTPEATED